LKIFVFTSITTFAFSPALFPLLGPVPVQDSAVCYTTQSIAVLARHALHVVSECNGLRFENLPVHQPLFVAEIDVSIVEQGINL
jgi:hypothetical protein